MRQREEIPDLTAVMFVMNLSILLFYAVVVFVTTARICRSFEAYNFLSTVRQIPQRPYVMPSRALISYGLLTLISFGKRRGKYLSGFVCVAEIALCCAVVASLNFYYTGVALLVLSDLTHYIQNHRVRLGFMIPLSLLFALGRYEIAYAFTNRIPFDA